MNARPDTPPEIDLVYGRRTALQGFRRIVILFVPCGAGHRAVC
ncbi:MAG: hypothetical protein ACR2GR_12165 [Rhodothermales bacterium]